MAYIDKIHGTFSQYKELEAWLTENRKDALQYLHHHLYTNNKEAMRPIATFPKDIDKWLYFNCPIAWVINAIKSQYGSNLSELLRNDE